MEHTHPPEKDNAKALADEIANRLMRLHQDLENSGSTGTDWSIARSLEDRIGGYQPLKGDLERAETLLAKYGF